VALEQTQAGLRRDEHELSAAHTSAVAVQVATDARARSLAEQLHDLEAAVVGARDGADSVGARQRELRAQACAAEQLADAGRTLRAATAHLNAALVRANREAADAGFDTLAEARAAAITSGEIDELQRLVDAWQDEADRLHAVRSAQEFDGLDADPDVLAGMFAAARAAVGIARTELAEAAVRSDDAAAGAARAEHGLHRFTARLADVDEAIAEHDRTDADSEPVRYLSRLTRGMAGRRRVALTTFVLRRWFEHVVQAANVRLALISSGRYELVRVDEGAARAERAGLTLQVIDRHTGEARSARSLSGGETFYTSLALALGLADVVRAEAGGIDLDTLFIDEGFGSLDAQTLDEVMTVIEDLRDRGRVVGIVSHVTDLKELIHERVEVRRLADGSSSLRVVA
jgi:exonuclease SbcC